MDLDNFVPRNYREARWAYHYARQLGFSHKEMMTFMLAYAGNKYVKPAVQKLYQRYKNRAPFWKHAQKGASLAVALSSKKKLKTGRNMPATPKTRGRKRTRSRSIPTPRTTRSNRRARVGTRSRSGSNRSYLAGRARSSSSMSRIGLLIDPSVRTNSTRSRSASVGRGSTSRLGGVFSNKTNSKKLATTTSQKTQGYHMKNGVFVSKEVGATYALGAASACLYIGHSTSPQKTLQLSMFLALAKKLLVLQGISVNDVDAAFPQTSGDKITIAYRDNYQPGTAEQYYQYTTTGSTSARNLADAWMTTFATKSNQLNLVYIEWLPGTSASVYSFKKYNLRNATLKVNVKSVMRMQNRTVNKAGQINVDDIYAIPLIGKEYGGIGSGTTYFGTTNLANSPFIAEDDHGLIIKPADAVSLQEPPPKIAFKPLKYAKNLTIGPAAIKVSSLSDNMTIGVNKFITKVWNGTTGLITYDMNSYGKFRFFGLEKCIESNVPAEGENIAIGYQLQYDVGVSVSLKAYTMTEAVVSKTFL